MPAYRSEAEAEIRLPVVAHLREMLSGCRIIHEINACGFGNRIDVLAVGADEIAAVEIKSAKDKIDRLPDQIKAMRGITNNVFAAVHEKFLKRNGSNVWPPDEASGAVTWVWPKKRHGAHIDLQEVWQHKDRWAKPKHNLPPTAIDILWRDELQAICKSIGAHKTSSLTMEEGVDIIRWEMTGKQITRAICAALRARECVEADPPITKELEVLS